MLVLEAQKMLICSCWASWSLTQKVYARSLPAPSGFAGSVADSRLFLVQEFVWRNLRPFSVHLHWGPGLNRHYCREPQTKGRICISWSMTRLVDMVQLIFRQEVALLFSSNSEQGRGHDRATQFIDLQMMIVSSQGLTLCYRDCRGCFETESQIESLAKLAGELSYWNWRDHDCWSTFNIFPRSWIEVLSMVTVQTCSTTVWRQSITTASDP